MNGHHQLTRDIHIAAPRDRVWAVVADSRLLPNWAPPVKTVERIDSGDEGVGATRLCHVEFGGRRGKMTERCVEFEPAFRVGYVVDDDSLGFSRMFADYGFTITLEDSGDGASRARTDTYYTPRNWIFGLMNALVMRRRFATTVEQMLVGLKRTSESERIVST